MNWQNLPLQMIAQQRHEQLLREAAHERLLASLRSPEPTADHARRADGLFDRLRPVQVGQAG
jgi:hypothetical protein